jgi:predicted  nucleic acid-binding Zn-ribbon protein
MEDYLQLQLKTCNERILQLQEKLESLRKKQEQLLESLYYLQEQKQEKKQQGKQEKKKGNNNYYSIEIEKVERAARDLKRQAKILEML